jgi:hypothetical protein
MESGERSELTSRGQRVELHSGVAGTTKAALAFLLLFGAIVLAPILGGICGLFASLLSTWAGVAVGFAVTIGCMCLLVGRLLWILRSAAWLDRTTLVVRGMVRTRRCDLAAAVRFRLESIAETQPLAMPFVTLVVPTGRRVPQLTVHEATGGRGLRFRLIDPATRRILDPSKLVALADAIVHGRAGGPDTMEAWQTAAIIREMTGLSRNPPC